MLANMQSYDASVCVEVCGGGGQAHVGRGMELTDNGISGMHHGAGTGWHDRHVELV